MQGLKKSSTHKWYFINKVINHYLPILQFMDNSESFLYTWNVIYLHRCGQIRPGSSASLTPGAVSLCRTPPWRLRTHRRTPGPEPASRQGASWDTRTSQRHLLSWSSYIIQYQNIKNICVAGVPFDSICICVCLSMLLTLLQIIVILLRCQQALNIIRVGHVTPVNAFLKNLSKMLGNGNITWTTIRPWVGFGWLELDRSRPPHSSQWPSLPRGWTCRWRTSQTPRPRTPDKNCSAFYGMQTSLTSPAASSVPGSGNWT